MNRPCIIRYNRIISGVHASNGFRDALANINSGISVKILKVLFPEGSSPRKKKEALANRIGKY